MALYAKIPTTINIMSNSPIGTEINKKTIAAITATVANNLGWQKNRNVNNAAIKLILIPPYV